LKHAKKGAIIYHKTLKVRILYNLQNKARIKKCLIQNPKFKIQNKIALAVAITLE